MGAGSIGLMNREIRNPAGVGAKQLNITRQHQDTVRPVYFAPGGYEPVVIRIRPAALVS